MSVRSPRLALAVEESPDWRRDVRAALYALSETWGGLSAVVMSGDRFEPWMLRLLQRVDPDFVGQYERTARTGFPDHADADAIEDWVEGHARRVRDSTGVDLEMARHHAIQMLDQRISGWTPSEAFRNRVAEGLAPFEGRAIALDNSGSAPYGVVDIKAIIREPTLGPIHTAQTGWMDDELRLLVALRVGGISPNYWNREADAGAEPVTHSIEPQDLVPFCTYLWTGKLDESYHRLARAYAEQRGEAYSRPSWASPEFIENTPFMRSMFGLVRLMPRSRTIWRESEPLLVVIGDSVNDFFLAMAWDRMFGNGIWMPKRWMGSRTNIAKSARTALGSVLSNFLVRNREAKVLVTSTSLERRSLGAYLGHLRRRLIVHRDRAVTAEVESLPMVEASVWLDRIQFDRNAASTWLGHVQADQVDTPLPTDVRSEQPSALGWLVDITVPKFRPPVRSALRPLLAEEPQSLRDWSFRPSNVGTTYRAQHIFVDGGQTLDRTAIRPRLRMPDAIESLNALASRAGYSLRPSDKGGFFRAASELWGGIGPLGDDLANAARSSVIASFHSGEKERPGMYVDQAKRRYLTFHDCMVASGMSETALRSWLDRLDRCGVVERGMLLKCSTCRLLAWYHSTEVGTEFQCQRCRSSHHLEADVWTGSAEQPYWYYRLAEVVHQATQGDFFAIVLTLHRLRQAAEHSFDFAPQLDVLQNEERRWEFDICAMVDGKVIVGEAKSRGRLAGTQTMERQLLNRLATTANLVTADRVVLATSDTRWRPETMSLARKKLDSPWWGVDIWAARDLVPSS